MTSTSVSRHRPWRDQPFLWLGVVAVYFVLLGLRLSLVPATFQTTIWPVAGIFAAGVLLLRPRQKLYALGATTAGVAAMAAAGLAPVSCLVSGLAEAWFIILLVSRLCGPNANFARGRTLALAVGGAVLPACLASTGVNYLLGDHTPNEALGWFVGHLVGAAVMLPTLSIVLDHRRFAAVSGPRPQLAALLCAIVLSALALFIVEARAFLFLLFPMAMLLTFRHGPVGSAAATLALTGLALVYNAAVAPGDAAAGAEIHVLQALVAVVMLTSLPAAGAIAANARIRALLVRRTAVARDARSKADLAAAARGEFLANMSHEIRTPLNGVMGLADALSRTDLTPSQRELLRMILVSGKALTGLLSDALDMARADSGALRLSVEPVDLRQTLSEAAYLFEGLAREKGLSFDLEFDLDAPGAAADALRVKQVVSNLISNAVKFTERGGVTMRTSFQRAGEDHGILQVVVRDTGPGFDETVRARLFQRFEQADASVTRRYGGSGLGLSIAYRLARMMGGALTAEGDPGKGAAFTFTAPFAIAAIEAAPPPIETCPEPQDGERRLSVLLAEDNHINQKVIKAMIGDLVELTVVGDGEAAVEAFHQRRFDVILMDTHMPILDGLSATRRIREGEAHAGLRRTPIVSLTADAMPQQVEAARVAGADLHVAKPISAETLVRALHTCVQSRANAQAA